VTAFQEGEFYSGEFLPAYEEMVGTSPTSVFHLHAFDSANVIFNAIEQIAIENEDGSISIPRMALKDALFATELPWHDVHGRPTVVRLSTAELARKFGR